MKVIDRYLLKTYIGPFILTFLVVLFVFLMQFLWKYIDDLVGKGLEITIILKLIFFAAFTFIPMSIPLAILLSGLITFGNIAEKNELTAMKSAGVSLYRIIQPLFILAICLSLLNFAMSNNIVPVMTLKFRSLLEDIRDQKLALNIEEGVFYRGIDGYIIRIGDKERDNQTIHDVLIYDHTRTTGLATLTYAKHGSMVMSENKQYLILGLEDGFLYDENIEFDASKPTASLPILRGTFDFYQIRFDLTSFQMQETNEEFFKDSYEMLNVNQLNKFIDTIQTEITTIKTETANSMLKNFRYISLHYNDSIAHLYADSVSKTYEMTAEEKQKVFAHAIQTAREQSSLLDFNLIDTESKQKRLWRYEIEWHRKYVLSFACILLFFVGVSLGAIIRKGGLGVPLAVAILVFVIYWAISSTGERMTRVGTIPSEWGMWLSTLILLPLAILFLYKASTEAGLSDMSILQQRLHSLKDFFTRKKKRKNTQ
jgi:lipopolysaccharide export system permease protein